MADVLDQSTGVNEDNKRSTAVSSRPLSAKIVTITPSISLYTFKTNVSPFHSIAVVDNQKLRRLQTIWRCKIHDADVGKLERNTLTPNDWIRICEGAIAFAPYRKVFAIHARTDENDVKLERSMRTSRHEQVSFKCSFTRYSGFIRFFTSRHQIWTDWRGDSAVRHLHHSQIRNLWKNISALILELCIPSLRSLWYKILEHSKCPTIGMVWFCSNANWIV